MARINPLWQKYNMWDTHVLYPRERGPMGDAPYIGPKLGDGPILEVSVARLYSKERPGKLPTLAS